MSFLDDIIEFITTLQDAVLSFFDLTIDLLNLLLEIILNNKMTIEIFIMLLPILPLFWSLTNFLKEL
jgi:hypothetical protein